jgi:hypothetical protein
MRDEQASYYSGMHLRPKCSGTLILLIVHVDDLKPTINQRGRNMEFSETRI